jgi:carbamoyltransferase
VIVLGLNRGEHDASACVLRDGRMVSFINTERLTRIKRDPDRVWEAARYCLEVAGVTEREVDLVVQNSYRFDLEQADRINRSRGKPDDAGEYVSQFSDVVTIHHHLAHAYCGVGLSPFDDCAVLVMDGVGQIEPNARAEAETGYEFRDRTLRPVLRRTGTVRPWGASFHAFESIGAAYSAISSYLFGDWNECGKVMGLAPYGANGKGPAWQVVRVGDNGELAIDLAFLDDLHNPNIDASCWARYFDEYRRIAHAIQRELERAYLHLARDLHARTGARNLVVTGGVALNCTANQQLVVESPFDRVFVPPGCGDDGIAIGCAFYGWLEHAARPKLFALSHPYYGRTYTDDEIHRVLADEPLVEVCRTDQVARDTAALLASGKILGWFQGASEFGARALGNRSILCDPRRAEMKDIVNARVKHREAFRPFAGAIPVERRRDYLACEQEVPYMTFAVPVHPAARERIPAIVHVDGTCRAQTVRRDDNPRFHELIEAFGELTGVHVILNTSFNDKGEPIVETPLDALDCFLSTELDALVVHQFVVRKRPIWDGDRLDPTIAACRLAARRQIDLTRHLAPGLPAEITASAAAPPTSSVKIPARFAALFDELGGPHTLEQIAARLAPTPDELRELVAIVLQLRSRHLIRLIAPEACRPVLVRRERDDVG